MSPRRYFLKPANAFQENVNKLIGKERFLKLKSFALEMLSMFRRAFVRESIFSVLKQSKFNYKSQMAHKMLENCLLTCGH